MPEAQLDRFMFNILIDYPSFEEEQDIVKANTTSGKQDQQNIITKED